MNQILQVITQLSVLAFVLSSMLSMGLSLNIAQIMVPLRNTRLILLGLAANFALVPLLAYLILQVIPLEQDLATGLIIMACAAGSPFLPKLAESAKGNIAFSVGLMALLMVVTVIYLPLVLPLLLQGASVNPWAIAQSLIVMMLIPLGIGLFTKARYESLADALQPQMSQASTVALLLLMVVLIVLNFQTILGLIGTGGLGAIFVFLVCAFVIGYLLGGGGPGIKSVLGLGTAQRNLSAALVVAGQNFADNPNVLVMIIVAAILGLIILGAISGELGKLSQAPAETAD
jgi:predicted Na+-dependent transporter